MSLVHRHPGSAGAHDPLVATREFALVYVCVHACVCACMCACMHVCVHACVRACMCACMHVCVRACVRACMCVCMHVCVHACVRARMCACMHVCMCCCLATIEILYYMFPAFRDSKCHWVFIHSRLFILDVFLCILSNCKCILGQCPFLTVCHNGNVSCEVL